MKNRIFTEVYNTYHKLVIKSVKDITGNLELAWEICHNTFVKYYIQQEYVKEGFDKAWLLFTAKNEAIDYTRRFSTKNEISNDMLADEYIDHEKQMEKKIEDTELLFRILEDLKLVNEKWFDVIISVCVDGESIDEAAQHLGITPKMLSNRLYRARKYVRGKYLCEYQEQ